MTLPPWLWYTIIMMKTRAKTGGEIGINGEYYKGGQFLPSSPNTIKGEMKSTNSKKATRKQEIAPYKWEVSPAENLNSIFSIIAGTVAGWKVYNETLEYNANEKVLNYVGMTEEEARELINMWNDGYRWFERK